jgi:hypothetical protein
MKKWPLELTPSSTLFMRSNDSLIIEGWLGDKLCYITITTGASVTMEAESAGWPIDSI